MFLSAIYTPARRAANPAQVARRPPIHPIFTRFLGLAFTFFAVHFPLFTLSQCPDCGNGLQDAGETTANCPQDVPHAATCTSPCAQPTAFETTVGIRQAYDFIGSTTYTTGGLPVGWAFAGAPTPTTAGALPAADAFGNKAGLVQPNCSGSCTSTNGFCIGNLANNVAVGAGGSGGKLGANFDGRANINANLSYAVLRGQNNPTLVSPTYDLSGVNGFKVQFWLFPSETSCGQLNSWGSCVGNAAFLDFSANGGTSWTQILQMDLSSTGTDMCFNNSTNTKWLTESAWSRVCLTVFRNTSGAGYFYTAATGTTAASGMMVNSAFFTNAFKFRIRYSQTASCTSGITTTNPGRYLAIDYPVITSGNQMIPCGISFANMCGYGADDNDDGVGSSVSTSFSTAFGTVRRGVNQAERGVEIFHSQSAAYASQNLSGSNFATNFDLCNAEGGDRQCIDWQTNNNFYTAIYECIADWEAPTGATGINLQYYEGSTPQSTGMSKVTTAGRTALIGWRYSANRFVSCSSLSDLNPGCNGYAFASASLPIQFARGFYHLAHNSTGQSWSVFGATSCSHYFNGPFFAPIAVPDTLTGSGNYTLCVSNNLVFTGLSEYCFDGSGMSGGGTLTITGPNSFSETINSGGQGTTPIVDPGVYVVTANTPSSPAQCLDCSRRVCITVTPADIANCGIVPVPGLTFWAELMGDGHSVAVKWSMLRDEDAEGYIVQRRLPDEDWVGLAEVESIIDHEDYAYIDPTGFFGPREYRLQVLLPNGNTDYSHVVTLNIPSAQDKIVSLWPNPASDILHVRVADSEGPVRGFSAALYDLAGRKLRVWDVDGMSGELSLEGIMLGVYWVRIAVSGRVEGFRVGVN
jgi:hypothetical protein